MSNPNTDKRHLRGPVRASLLGGALVVALAAVIVARTVGAPQARAVVIAGVLVAVFFGVGLLLMSTALKFPPKSALVLALLTYVLQLALITLAFLILDRSGALGEDVDAAWLTLAAAVLSLLVIVGLMRWASKVRVPIYDLDDAPSAGRATSDPGAGRADGTSSPLRTPSAGREAGAR